MITHNPPRQKPGESLDEAAKRFFGPFAIVPTFFESKDVIGYIGDKDILLNNVWAVTLCDPSISPNSK